MYYVILDSYTKENKEIWNDISLFEKQFTYPMNDKKFIIEHGRLSYYPNFFEKIGDSFKTIVIYDNKEIICTITGVIQNDIAYICDNKVSKHVKNKNKLLKEIFKKINDELKLDNKFYFINMNPSERNPIISLVERKFGFNLNVYTQYITEYTKQDLSENLTVGTNTGIKDIIIDDIIIPLYHLNSGDILVKNIPDNSMILELTDYQKENSYPITIASHNCSIKNISSSLLI